MNNILDKAIKAAYLVIILPIAVKASKEIYAEVKQIEFKKKVKTKA